VEESQEDGEERLFKEAHEATLFKEKLDSSCSTVGDVLSGLEV